MSFLKRLWNRTPQVVEVPTEDRQQLEGLETWIVQWMARSGRFSERVDLSHVKSVSQAFTNKEDALKFEEALLDAFALVRDTITPNSIEVFKM